MKLHFHLIVHHAFFHWHFHNLTIHPPLPFQPEESYDLWHDRATFHFLTKEDQVTTYVNVSSKAVSQYLIISTFSENGPEKCSGLPIRKYSVAQLKEQFSRDFISVDCITEDHITPFQTTQNFVFCSFKKR